MGTFNELGDWLITGYRLKRHVGKANSALNEGRLTNAEGHFKKAIRIARAYDEREDPEKFCSPFTQHYQNGLSSREKFLAEVEKWDEKAKQISQSTYRFEPTGT